MKNILKIYRNMDVPVIVTLNSFVTDTEAENEYIRQFCEEKGCEFRSYQKYGKKAEKAASVLQRRCWRPWKQRRVISIRFISDESQSWKKRSRRIAKEIYGADGVVYEPAAQKQLAKIADDGIF